MYKPKTLKGRLMGLAIVAAVVALALVGITMADEGEVERQRLSRQERLRLAREDSAALKVAVMPTLDCLPLYVARHYHFLDSLGDDIRLRQFAAQMDCDTALAGGSVEGAMTDLVRAEWMQGKGIPLVYASQTEASWQLIAARAARIKQLKQLYDKMLAMTRYSATDLLADKAVDSAKVKDERVFRIQVNDVGVRLDMMLNGEMDAALMPEPQATVARLAKGNVLLDTRKMGLRLGVLAFRKVVADNADRQRQMATLRKAYNQACDSIAKHGIAHYAQLLNNVYHLPDSVARQLPGDIKFTHIAQPRPADVEQAKRWVEDVRKPAQ